MDVAEKNSHPVLLDTHTSFEDSSVSEENKQSFLRFDNNRLTSSTGPVPLPFNPVCINAVLDYFRISLHPHVNTEGDQKKSFGRWLKSLGTSPLNGNLLPELALVTSLINGNLDWKDEYQQRMMQTIYWSLTGAAPPSATPGSFWQHVGFQGAEPGRDVRRTGLWSLLQLLQLCTGDTKAIGCHLFLISISHNQPFPLAVLSINVTNIVLNMFDTGRLNRECNFRNSIIDVLNGLYNSLLLFIMHIWTSQNKTIKDSGFLLKDAEKHLSKNFRKMLKELPSQLENLQDWKTDVT